MRYSFQDELRTIFFRFIFTLFHLDEQLQGHLQHNPNYGRDLLYVQVYYNVGQL